MQQLKVVIQKKAGVGARRHCSHISQTVEGGVGESRGRHRDVDRLRAFINFVMGPGNGIQRVIIQAHRSHVRRPRSGQA